MKVPDGEKMRAERVSAAVDELVGDPNAQPKVLDVRDAGLVDTARQFANLPRLLGSVDPLLEQRVAHLTRTRRRRVQPPRYSRPAWALAGLVAGVVMVLLFTPLGQTAVASFMTVFHLGRTEVSITPVDSPVARPEGTRGVLAATAVSQETAVRQRLTLSEAQALVPFRIPEPGYLPTGYLLQGVNSYSYPGLPAWVPQPLFVELVYGTELGDDLTLRVYPIMLGSQATISRLNLQATPIHAVQDVDVGGQPGVLLQLDSGETQAGWQEVVWEQEELILALSASDLPPAKLLRIARSVR